MLFTLLLHAMVAKVPASKLSQVVKGTSTTAIQALDTTMNRSLKTAVAPSDSIDYEGEAKSRNDALQRQLKEKLLSNDLPKQDTDAIFEYQALWFNNEPLPSDLEAKLTSISKSTFDVLNAFFKQTFLPIDDTYVFVVGILNMNTKRFQ